MRKWTYLVAALLIGGTAATVTSCIDNEEPAGITELRGAKAELLKAKADYERVLITWKEVAIERDRVALEKEKVGLKMEELKLEMQTAVNDWKKDSLQAMRDTLALSLQVSMFELQEKQKKAEYEYNKALANIDAAMLTMKDDVYAWRISYYRALLAGGTYKKEDGSLAQIQSGLLDALSTAQSNLLGKQISRLEFVTGNQNFVAGKEISLAANKKTLEIQQGLLATLEELNAANTTDIAALNAKKAEKQNEQNALDTKENEQIIAIKELRSALAPATNAIAEEQVKLNTPETFTIAKVADETMHDDLYYALDRVYNVTANTASAFKQNQITGKYEMVKDWTMEGFNLSNKANYIGYATRYIKEKYQESFRSAYSNMIEYLYPASEAFDAKDGTLKESYRAKVENELTRLKIDFATIKANAEADSAAWIMAYANYMAALKDYNNYQGTTYRNQIVKALNDYVNLTTPATVAQANTLRTQVITYLNKRYAVDGEGDLTITETWKDAVTDATLANFNTDVNQWNTNSGYYLGAQTLIKYVYNLSLADKEKNTLKIFLVACDKMNGMGAMNLTDAVEPIVSGNSYDMPADYEPTSGSYGLYINSAEALKIFNNIDNWIALYQEVDKAGRDVADAVAAINEKIAELKKNSIDKLTELWIAEVNCYLIKGVYTQRDNEIWSTTIINPYESIYRNDYNLITEYSTIQSEINNIDALINGTKYFSYVVYNPSSGYDVRTTANLDGVISGLKSTITRLETSIATTQQQIDLFKEYGFDSNGQATANNCLTLMDQEIEKLKKQVEYAQAEVEANQAILKKLLDAYAAGDAPAQ